MNLDKIKLSPTGNVLLFTVLNYIKETLEKYDFVHTRVFFPSPDGNEVLYIEQSRLIDELIEKFEIKNAFDSRNSEYFEFIKETSLDIMRLKISNESPDHYIYITQFTNKTITILIRDPEAFGITKLELIYKNDDFELKTIENLPSNPYTNPMCELSSN